MTRLLRSTLLAVLAAAPLGAQQPAAGAAPATPAVAGCNIDFNQPKELVTVYNIGRPRAIQLPAGDERGKAILGVLKAVNNPKVSAANPQASAVLTGEMLVLWMMQPGVGPTATRGALSLAGDAAATIDLAKTADSLFTSIEASNPSCRGDLKIWREAKPWQDRINGAFKALAASQFDSAEVLAKSSMVLDRTSPYAHRVLAAVAQSRKKEGEMLQHLGAALALTAGDTAYLDDRRAVQFQIGQIALEYAETQPEPARTQILRQAVDAMVALATESPAAEATPYALSGLGMAAMSLKDTTLFLKCFSMVDGAPDKYTDLSSLQAAVCAHRAGKIPDAVRMFQATMAKNPNSRDALYNAAALMYDLRKGAEMLPVVTKLVEIDPSNPDNISLFAYAYNVLNEQSKPTTTLAPAKPAPGAKPAKPVPAAPAVPAAPKNTWVDSVAKYMKISDDMPVRLTIVEFNRYAERATLRGEVENRSKVARAYEVEFEFLDLAGAVLEKQVAKVESTGPGKAGTFSLTVTKPKVAAWRYAPIK